MRIIGGKHLSALGLRSIADTLVEFVDIKHTIKKIERRQARRE